MAIANPPLYKGPDKPEPKRWTTTEFARLDSIGIDTTGCELLDGEIVLKNAERLRHWTVDEYVAMDNAGLLSKEGEHYELLDGEIIEKLGQNDPHITGISLSAEALREVFGRGFIVSEHRPIRMGGGVPEPDVSVLRGNPRDYERRAPRSEEVLLYVEVVDTRPDTARKAKVKIYARHGIQEYWILNVRTRTLEVRRGPNRESETWSEIMTYSDRESVSPLGAPAASISVMDLLPSPLSSIEPA